MHDQTLHANGGVPDDPASAIRSPVRRLDYDGLRGPLAKMAISIALLTLMTLGFYRFWGKTRVRRYLCSRVSFLGDRAEYTGTGQELLFGFLAAILVLALLAGSFAGIEIALGVGHPVHLAALAVYPLVMLVLVFVAQYRARRYRLSRIRWRGSRFAQDGSSLRYALLGLGWGTISLLTLGIAYPLYRTRLQRYRATHTSFGTQGFRFDGRAVELMKTWLVAWLLLLPSLGLSYVWYRVREFRYFAGRVRCGSLAFSSDLRTVSMLRIIVVYGLLTLLTVALLGAAVAPVATGPSELDLAVWGTTQSIDDTYPRGLPGGDLVAYVLVIALFFSVISVLRTLFLVHPFVSGVTRSISVLGDENYAAIAQAAQSMMRQGEGLADALDVGAV